MAAAGRRRENTSEHAVRGSRGRWLPGTCPNPGGRPRVVADIRDLARQHRETALATLVEIAERGENESARVAAANAILDRGYGRPTQPLSGDDNAPPIGLSVVDREAETERKRAATRAVLDEAFGNSGDAA